MSDPQEQSIFIQALERDAGHRGAFLDEACASDPALRARVERLLHHHEHAASFLAEPAVGSREPRADADADAERPMREGPGTAIGPYQLLEQIGEGGMGMVFLAEQTRPVRRHVALKVIKAGMDTRQVVARFEAERQALAIMDHPHIAKVFDGGMTDSGRPYFVMELVKGEPITAYCDRNQLATRQRLELFAEVCHAVQHAHQKGIIHRDLKNTNVLVAEVDSRAVPKVIDFGVAKVIDQPLGERAVQTEQGQLIGTPEYMSPEQAERGPADVDTRSDVYSLGVLLYELIAGVPPIASEVLRGGSYEQVRRVIRDADPPRPSARLSTLGGADAARVAQRRSTTLPALIRDLRSELEWIPLKAMRKDREQRYRSAVELADDVRNYLGGRPLIAGPESGSYRARKFLRRHKAGVAAAAAMLLLLIGGIIATTWQATRANREAAAAKKQASIARSVNELMTDMIRKANRGQEQGDPNVTVRAVMDAAAADLDAGHTPRELQVEAALREAIGETYTALGLYSAAEPLLREALAQRIGMTGIQNQEVVTSQSNLANLLRANGDFDGAEALLRQVLATSRNLHGSEHEDVVRALNSLAGLLWAKGDYASAEPLFRDALALGRKVLSPEHPDIVYSVANLGAVLSAKGDYDTAEALCREALAIHRKTYGEQSPEVAAILNNLAMLLVHKGDYAAAEAPAREALAMRRKLLGEGHPEVAQAINNLGGLLTKKGDYAGAEPLFRQALALRRQALGDEHPDVLMTMRNLAETLRQKGDYSSAESLIRDALRLSRKVSGDDHANTLSLMSDLGRFLAETNRLPEAEPLFDALYRRVPSSQLEPKNAARQMSLYGPCLVGLAKYDEAETPLREALKRLTATDQTRGEHMKRVLRALAEVCDHTNRPEEAGRWREELSKLQPARQPATRPS